MKSISTINPAITENRECSIGVSLDDNVLLRFVLLLALRICWATFQAKNNIRSTPASFALTRTEATTHVPQIITYAAVEKRMELKGERS